MKSDHHIFDRPFSQKYIIMSPRTEEQYEEIRKGRKEQILHVALHLFAEKGYENTSISMIAREAAISKGLLYNYFENKEHLLEEVVQQGIKEIMIPIESDAPVLETPKQFRNFIDGNFRELMSNQEHWKLYFTIMIQPSVSDKVAGMMQDLVSPWIKILENYYRIRGEKDPGAKALLLGALMDGIGIQMVINNSRPELLGVPIENVKEMIIKNFS